MDIFMKLALFDLDHTLLDTDSDHSWGEFLVTYGNRFTFFFFNLHLNEYLYEIGFV